MRSRAVTGAVSNVRKAGPWATQGRDLAVQLLQMGESSLSDDDGHVHFSFRVLHSWHDRVLLRMRRSPLLCFGMVGWFGWTSVKNGRTDGRRRCSPGETYQESSGVIRESDKAITPDCSECSRHQHRAYMQRCELDVDWKHWHQVRIEDIS